MLIAKLQNPALDEVMGKLRLYAFCALKQFMMGRQLQGGRGADVETGQVSDQMSELYGDRGKSKH